MREWCAVKYRSMIHYMSYLSEIFPSTVFSPPIMTICSNGHFTETPSQRQKLKIIARHNIASSDLQNMQKRVFIISTEKQIIGNHCASDMSIMLHILQKCENT